MNHEVTNVELRILKLLSMQIMIKEFMHCSKNECYSAIRLNFYMIIPILYNPATRPNGMAWDCCVDDPGYPTYTFNLISTLCQR